VNFGWVYGLEAHPEEAPWIRGLETRDLGWTHSYYRPTMMEERAQRARWMKTELEPDAEIPMLIDYINSELGPNDAIWSFYTGGGFYSGFVIDCDGTILQSLNWGWLSPGGQWFNLPLAPVRTLEEFLDDYLANPPACYQPPTGPSEPPLPRDPGTPSEAIAGSPTILIVDDDEGSSYEGYFKIPLGDLKQHYEVWEVQEDGSPSVEVLDGYEAVVWFTGDAFQETLTETDRGNLAAYLDAGGKLLLTGQHIGEEIGGTAFYRDYLHAAQVVDDANDTSLIGADLFSGVRFSLFGSDGAGNQDAPSAIEPLDDAAGVLHYETLPTPAYGGLRWSGDYQVVYLAFGLEGIGDGGAAAYRFKLIKRVLAWFSLLGDLDSDTDRDLDDHAAFSDCMRGPMRGSIPSCNGSDIDGDADADLADFSALQRAFTGSQ